MSGRRPVLLLFTRLPEPGRVKTRLVPDLGTRAACALHRALWADTLDLAARVRARAACDVVVAWTGRGRPEALTATASFPCRLLRQEGDDLGARLAHAHALLLAAHPAVVTLGSDSPWLGASTVAAAFDLLRRADVAIAPADDGGYVLLGASRFLPHLFRDIPWGSGDVLAATRRAIDRDGAGVAWLPGGYDVDDAASLARLRRHLARSPATLCPATRQFLATLA